MRTNLKVFRIKQKMTQAEFAKAVGYTRSHYGRIENGDYDPRQEFWEKLKKRFNVSDTLLLQLMKKDEE